MSGCHSERYSGWQERERDHEVLILIAGTDVGHRGAPVLGEVVATPRSQDRTLPFRYRIAIAASAFPSAYRASGSVL
jgi:hypothetical protein